jgi:hypothetical protein
LKGWLNHRRRWLITVSNEGVKQVNKLTVEITHQNGVMIAEINDFPADVLKTLLLVGKLEYKGLRWEIRDAFVYLEDPEYGLENSWVVLEVV